MYSAESVTESRPTGVIEDRANTKEVIDLHCVLASVAC